MPNHSQSNTLLAVYRVHTLCFIDSVMRDSSVLKFTVCWYPEVRLLRGGIYISSLIIAVQDDNLFLALAVDQMSDIVQNSELEEPGRLPIMSNDCTPLWFAAFPEVESFVTLNSTDGDIVLHRMQL